MLLDQLHPHTCCDSADSQQTLLPNRHIESHNSLDSFLPARWEHPATYPYYAAVVAGLYNEQAIPVPLERLRLGLTGGAILYPERIYDCNGARHFAIKKPRLCGQSLFPRIRYRVPVHLAV